MINYNNKSFRPIQNTANGETSSETLFTYKQEGNIISSEYRGGKIIYGQLIGLVNKDGSIEICYHQINNKIKRIPKEIQYLNQLIELSLSGNQIKKIPKEIKYLNQLTYLDLGNNKIKRISKEIQYFKQLRELSLIIIFGL